MIAMKIQKRDEKSNDMANVIPVCAENFEHARALRSIGARRVRREGRQWVWRLENSSG
jgi:hypothetical protein